MAEKQKMRTPSGVAGLVRYDEMDTAKISMKPIHVVGIAVAFAVIEAVLFFFVV